MHISNKLILFLPKLNNIHSQPLSSEIDETDICEASYACAVISSSAHPHCHFNGPRLAIASTCAWLWVEEALHFCDTVHCRGQSHQTACCCNRKTVRAMTSIPRPPLPPECLRMFLGDFVDFFIERSARGNESCPAPNLSVFISRRSSLTWPNDQRVRGSGSTPTPGNVVVHHVLIVYVVP